MVSIDGIAATVEVAGGTGCTVRCEVVGNWTVKESPIVCSWLEIGQSAWRVGHGEEAGLAQILVEPVVFDPVESLEEEKVHAVQCSLFLEEGEGSPELELALEVLKRLTLSLCCSGHY